MKRILATGSGTSHVSGDPGEFALLQVEKDYKTGVLWMTLYQAGHAVALADRGSL